MNAISFKYNGKLYNPKNPEKKLKQLGITWDDVEIVEQNTKEEDEPTESWHNPRLYYYLNPSTGYSITSIYPDLNVDGYEQCSKEVLERLWNKAR